MFFAIAKEEMMILVGGIDFLSFWGFAEESSFCLLDSSLRSEWQMFGEQIPVFAGVFPSLLLPRGEILPSIPPPRGEVIGGGNIYSK